MNQEDTAFVELLQWVSVQKHVPLEVRKDFMAHQLKVGYLDDKSRAFIERLMKQTEAKQQKSETQLAELDKKLMTLGKASYNDETGLKQRAVRDAEALINDLENHFVSSFKTRETELVNNAQSSQNRSDADQIAALKAGLNA
ncbi:hypothetical protein GW756_03350 [bacterium]|nr:hypothetical protein [bacterium]NCQ55446.1 hypothetical protein [Candidatus Parcubacteria bacterium]NCS67808.1 hypothetical protein [Candidatus Peregrinibacteria bacterium]NCS96378.1 hypothetical protein [bacterium]